MANQRIYAGVGSRETPQDILNLMTLASRQLSEDGWLLRTGGAKGADSAFAEGTARRETHLPWDGYNGLYADTHYGQIVPHPPAQTEEIAAAHHPNWHMLSKGVRQFMIRNVTLLLGSNLDDPARMVICWTPNGKITGGTGHSIRVANGFDIPVFNLALDEDFKRLEVFVNNQKD